MLVFSYFIRNAFELSQFVLISAINEVYDGNTHDSYRSISYGLSTLAILLYVLMIFFVILLIVSSYKLDELEHNKLEEIFREILNEICFGTLILFLAFINTENKWSSVLTNIYIWTITSNTLVTFFIVIGYNIKESIHWLRNCRTRKNTISNFKNAPTGNEIRTLKSLHPRMKLGSIHPQNEERFASKSLEEESKEDLNTDKKEESSQMAKNWSTIFYRS